MIENDIESLIYIRLKTVKVIINLYSYISLNVVNKG